MPTTALILRPNDAPEILVLECDGPRSIPKVNRSPGNFAPILSFEEWVALPEHLKESRERSGTLADYESAERISRLIENAEYQGTLTKRHIDEIQWRLEIMFPCCTGSLLRTYTNERSA